MDRNYLKYSPPYPGKISQFYRTSPFLFDFFYFLFHICFFSFFKSIGRFWDNSLIKKITKVVGDNKQIKLFGDGRSSLLSALNQLQLEEGKKVLLNPNTCNTVCDAIISSGLVPKFISTDKWGQGDINSVRSLISEDVRVIILTNTYGVLENYDEYVKLAKEHNLFIINDLAQSNIYDQSTREIIRKGNISILSFGPEKYLGALGGGVLISNQIIQSNENGTNFTNKEIFLTVISRFKYSLTFLCYRFRILKFLLKFPYLTYKFSDIKSTEEILFSKMKIRNIHPVLSVSVLFRFWLLQFSYQREKRNFTLLRSLLKEKIVCSPYFPDSIPSFAVINLESENRNHFAKHISDLGFQTLWNYVPLPEYKYYSKFDTGLKTDHWKKFLQIPFRFLSIPQVNQISKNILNYSPTRNFFDRSDWSDCLSGLFNLKKSFYDYESKGLKLRLSILEDKTFLYLNFIGYFDLKVDYLDESYMLELIENIEKKYRKKIIRMKLFPGIKFKKQPLRFIVEKTEILDISSFPRFDKDLKYEINKAIKGNIQIRTLTKKDLKSFYKIYLDTVKRVGSSYVTPLNLFSKIIDFPDCFILGAFLNNKIVGGSVYLCSGDYAYYWWNATSEDGRKFSANYLITKHAIELLKESSVRYLDFASSNNANILRTKQKWGTKQVVFYEYLP